MESGLYALFGALIGGLITVIAHAITQRGENTRNLQRLVFQAATTEWAKRYDAMERRNEKEGDQYNMQPITDFLLEFSLWAEVNKGLWKRDFNETDLINNARRIGDFTAKLREERLGVEAKRLAQVDKNMRQGSA